MTTSLLLAFLLATTTEPLAPTGILSEYLKYELMTPRPVGIDIALLESCVQFKPDERHDPHRNGFVSVFMNALAASAYRDSTAYPAGSIIVKRKEPMGGQGLAFGGMIKRAAGYDAANGDWEYFTGTPERGYRSGRLEECGDCHVRAQDTDYVFGDWSIPPPAR